MKLKSMVIQAMARFGAFVLVLALAFSFVAAKPAQAVDFEVATVASPTCYNLTYNMQFRSRDASTGGDVSELQAFLQEKGYLASEPTGYYGQQTVAAVKAFQLAHGISPLGTVGPVTRAKIKLMTCGVVAVTPVAMGTTGGVVTTGYYGAAVGYNGASSGYQGAAAGYQGASAAYAALGNQSAAASYGATGNAFYQATPGQVVVVTPATSVNTQPIWVSASPVVVATNPVIVGSATPIFDGSWGGTISMASACGVGALSLDFTIANGIIKGSSSDGGQFAGTVTSMGAFTATSLKINATGVLMNNVGTGSAKPAVYLGPSCVGTVSVYKK